MRWECSECGAAASASRRPVACAECGRAGVIFVETGRDESEDSDFTDLRQAWLEAGLRLAAGRLQSAPDAF